MKTTAKKLATVLVDACDGKSRKQVDEITQGLIAWLAERRETHLVRGTILALDQVWKKKYGASNVHVITAKSLDASLREKIGEIARGATIKELVDPSLIGGMRLRIDDRLIDGSVTGKLESLRQTLNQ